MIENLIFSFESIGDMSLIPERYNPHNDDNDFTSQISVNSGYRLVGLQSVDREHEDLGRVIDKIKFLFINMNDLRCRPPTDILVRDISEVFREYDLNEDGLISDMEFYLILTKLGRQSMSVEITEPLSFEDFQSYVVAYVMEDDGTLDMDKLIVKQQEEQSSNTDNKEDPVTPVIKPVIPDPKDKDTNDQTEDQGQGNSSTKLDDDTIDEPNSTDLITD